MCFLAFFFGLPVYTSKMRLTHSSIPFVWFAILWIYKLLTNENFESSFQLVAETFLLKVAAVLTKFKEIYTHKYIYIEYAEQIYVKFGWKLWKLTVYEINWDVVEKPREILYFVEFV